MYFVFSFFKKKQGTGFEAALSEAATTTLPWPEHAIVPCTVYVEMQ